MALSLNTLFHFTNSIEVLYKILEEVFWSRYCKETGWKGKGKPLFAIAMVSFCDIPLSQKHQHIIYYGNYGIGVSKEWAIKKNVAPVYYITREMIPYLKGLFGKDSYNSEINESVQKKKNEDYMRNFRRLMSRMKIYQGWNWKGKNNDKTIDNYPYYDEREWRYIPDMNSEKFIINVRNQNVDLDNYNQGTKEFCIKPRLNDIKYLIINSELERIKVLKKIDELFSETMTINDISLLKSKILTCEQIKERFLNVFIFLMQCGNYYIEKGIDLCLLCITNKDSNIRK